MGPCSMRCTSAWDLNPKPPLHNVGGVYHCHPHCHLPKFRDVIIEGKYSAVIGCKFSALSYVLSMNVQVMGFVLANHSAAFPLHHQITAFRQTAVMTVWIPVVDPSLPNAHLCHPEPDTRTPTVSGLDMRIGILCPEFCARKMCPEAICPLPVFRTISDSFPGTEFLLSCRAHR